MVSRILVIEDEASIRLLLKINLSARGYEIMEAGTVAEGLNLAISGHPHLVILDLTLPDGSGFTALKELRQWTKVPVIVVTAADREESKVTLLEAGADDYVTKPFSVAELSVN